MKKPMKLKDKLKKTLFKGYLYSILVIILFSFFSVLMVTDFIDVPRIRDLVSKNVSYTYKILREKILLIQNPLFNELKDTLYEMERSIDEPTKENLDTVFSKYKKKLESIDYVSRADYYLINKDGEVVLTSYATDLGLDLSKFKGFWKNLNDDLSKKGVVIHPLTAEILTGKSRVYAYKRLKDSNILEIGVELAYSFIESQFSEMINSLRNERMIENVSIYSTNFKPFGVIFKPLKDSEIDLYKEKLSRSNYYLEGLFKPTLKKRLIIKIKSSIFSDYAERNFVVVDLNFSGIYLRNFLNTFSIVAILIIFSIFNANKFSERISKQFEYLNSVITSYDPMNLDFKEIHNFEAGIVEFQEVIGTFQTMAERISADMQEITAINEELEKSYGEIEKKSSELETLLLEFAEKLALIAEGHDELMKRHLRMVKKLTGLILDELDLPEKFKDEILNYSILHDIGKIFVPDDILNKPGKLTDEEWEMIKKHTIYAKRLLDNPHFKVALNIAMYHHENYDGTGYPEGLKGDEIPIEAQIIKIVDVYDALRSERPYKKAFTHEEAMKIILKGDSRTSPSHFNPKLLKILKALSEKIKEMYSD